MRRSMAIVTVLALAGCVFGATGALAQEGPGQQPGITTTGYGEASAPAESADLEFLLFDETYYGGPPPFPEVEATPGAEARETVAPIVEAIETRDSIESVEVVVPLTSGLYGGPPPIARIEVTVSNPDLDMLTSLITGVTQAAASERLLVGHVGAAFATADCQALEREARQAALDDGRSRAEVQASLLGVGLGEVISSTDVDILSSPGFGLYGSPLAASGGCDPPVSASVSGEFTPGITLPGFDPATHSGEVEVYRQLQITFAIEDSAATPVA